MTRFPPFVVFTPLVLLLLLLSSEWMTVMVMGSLEEETTVSVGKKKHKVELGAVQTTMLIPLVGRAVETGKANGLIDDPKSVEIVQALDYDFNRWLPSLSSAASGSVLRTLLMDRDVGLFLDRYPHGTVVEMGCGLNTRFERLDNGQVIWFDLDLPDSIALRRNFFNYSRQPRRHMVAASVLDYAAWIPQVKETGGPWCFVSEAVVLYLDESSVESLVRTISNEFSIDDDDDDENKEAVWFVSDTVSKAIVQSQASHPVMRHLPQESWFRWGCDDPGASITAWTDGHMKLVRQSTFADVDDWIVARMQFPQNLLTKYLPFVVKMMTHGHYMNVFVSQGGGRPKDNCLVND